MTSRSHGFGLLALLAALPLYGLCAGCSADASSEPEGADAPEALAPVAELRAKIGSSGGELVGEVGGPLAGVRLVIPPGALSADTEVVVRAAGDPVPLALTAERVGPQIAIEPAGLRLALPAKLTVPFDAELRSQFAEKDDECKVWLRDGAGWTSAAHVASTPEGITIETSAFTVAAAGVKIVPRDLACRLLGNCPPVAPPCLEGQNLCMTRLKPPTVPAFETASMTVENGFAYFVHSPGPNSFTIAKHNLISVSSDTTLYRGIVNRAPSVPMSHRGRIGIDANDHAWLGLVGYGNMEFRPTAEPIARDTAASNPNAEAAGVVFADRDRSVRVRLTKRSESGAFTLHGFHGTNLFKIADVGANDLMFSRPRRLDSGVTEPLFSFLGTGKGVGDFGAGQAASNLQDPCGNAMTVNAEAANDTRFVACSDGRVHFGTTRDIIYTTLVGSTISSMAMDEVGNAYVVDATRAELVKVRPWVVNLENGAPSVVRFPLTVAAPGTPDHDRMLPRAIRYDKSTRTLVLVTRGIDANAIPEFYSIDRVL